MALRVEAMFDIPCGTVPNFLNLTLTPSNQILHPGESDRYVTFTLCHVTSGNVTLGCAWSRYDTFRDVTLAFVPFHYVRLRYVTLRRVTLCYVTFHFVIALVNVTVRHAVHFASDCYVTIHRKAQESHMHTPSPTLPPRTPPDHMWCTARTGTTFSFLLP